MINHYLSNVSTGRFARFLFYKVAVTGMYGVDSQFNFSANFHRKVWLFVDDTIGLVYQDLQEYIPSQYLPEIGRIYENLCQNNCKEEVALVALLLGITDRLSPDINEHMCAQRGKNHRLSFSTRTQMICYTSAEFARERYGVSDEVYQEILRFEDEEYLSEIKSSVKYILKVSAFV